VAPVRHRQDDFPGYRPVIPEEVAPSAILAKIGHRCTRNSIKTLMENDALYGSGGRSAPRRAGGGRRLGSGGINTSASCRLKGIDYV
jgi:hypothetical protein